MGNDIHQMNEPLPEFPAGAAARLHFRWTQQKCGSEPAGWVARAATRVNQTKSK
jgi:hypothetical protein